MPHGPVLGDREMPGAEWFPGTELSYAEQLFRAARPGETAIVHATESQPLAELTWDELADQVARCAAGLRRLGVGRGDRVAAYMPNVPETVVAFLACASIGAVWSSCAPEFGTPTVVDRFKQIEPKVLIATEGYRYGGKDFDRRGRVDEIVAAIPSIEHTVMVPSEWDALLAEPAELTFERLPFDHPLWVLYSSGTTGLPKAIVHGQGGVLLEHLKKARLHSDLSPGDRFFWFTTTGWMMWNFLVGGLLAGAAIVLYDGQPDPERLWQFGAEAGVTTFGTSAGLHRRVDEGGGEAAADAGAAERRLDRLAAGARGLRMDLRAVPRRVALLHERRHGPLHRVRGRVPAAAGLRRRAPGALPRRGGGGVERGRPAARERGGRARDHASRCPRCRSTSGTTRTASATARATSTCSPASGATATGSSSPSAAAR